MTRLDIDDCYFVATVQDLHSDGESMVQRFRQAEGRRFIAWEEGGWVYFKGRRTIMVPRSNVRHMVPTTPERAKILGPNPYEPKAEQKGGGK